MNNIFENAKFGDRFRTRDGRLAIYLSTEHRGSIEDKYNPPFSIVHVALERCAKYADGTENRWHDIMMYNEQGHSNRFDTETEYDDDVVGRWESDCTKLDLNRLENLALKSWNEKDYIVAVLPLKEQEARPVYMCGFIDGYECSKL